MRKIYIQKVVFLENVVWTTRLMGYSHDQDVLLSMESEGNSCVEFVGIG